MVIKNSSWVISAVMIFLASLLNPFDVVCQVKKIKLNESKEQVGQDLSGETQKVKPANLPSLEEMAEGIKEGRKYNVKKVIKANGGSSLFTRKEDNPELRAQYNFQRLRDPRSGLIPANIRDKELAYVLSSISKMQNPDNAIHGSANAPFATPGTQLTNWVNRGPFNVGGRTRALALDINDEDRILAGGVSGGLWESNDQGQTWARLTPAEEHPSVTDIVQDPRPGFQNI
ncbi:MAG: hypothetical protein AAFN93_27390, partial [Bacteroidota bacterium]